jgi:hypothetical protein
MNISETIKALPDEMTVAVLREDMVIAELVCTTSHLKRLITALESVEYELSHGDLIAGNVTRFSVKDALLKQVREALGK